MRKLSEIIRVGLKCLFKCLYKKEAKGDKMEEERTETHREGNVRTEVGVMWH